MIQLASQPAMTLIDAGAIRADLAQRIETKYAFNTMDVPTLRRVLLRTCRPIVYAGAVSVVRSIYFDDARLSAARANLDGIGIRHKTRLRWYDRPAPADRVFLESKWRRHRMTGKHRLHLSSSAPVGAMSYREMHASLREVAAEHLGSVHLSRDAEPVLMVEYKREHFALRDGDARFTLDYDMRFYPQFGRNRFHAGFAERLPGVVLIECKTPPRGMGGAHRALLPLQTRHTRFSKYVTGCQRLGYVRCV